MRADSWHGAVPLASASTGSTVSGDNQGDLWQIAPTRHSLTTMRAYPKLTLTFVSVLIVSLASLAWRYHESNPRVWAARDVPVAFWAWRNETPPQDEVERAAREARAQTLFLRSGQIHYEDGKLSRVREVVGQFPRATELHLVYNGTRALLTEFERIDEAALASIITEAYLKDVARAEQDGAKVTGVQLDIDAPTRLLARYARVLRAMRERLSQGAKLSVTGLPTWMESATLKEVLDVVDFWIPQCYGELIPEKLDQLVAISSPQTVARTIARARRLNRPFYAGLSAYGYAILYGRDKTLIALRGDLDPIQVANDPNLELVERRTFDARAQSSDVAQTSVASEWRYVYRARGDGIIDGLVMREGDFLMLDVPSAEALRASVRAVREQAGEKLLGICVFRLPGRDDPTTLTLEQIVVALSDDAPVMKAGIRLQRTCNDSSLDQEQTRQLCLTATSEGTASALMGEDAMTIELRVPAGSLLGINSLDGFASIETLCQSRAAHATDDSIELRPCSMRRANVLRLKKRTWTPGASARAQFSFNQEPTAELMAAVRTRIDDGRVWQREERLSIENGDKR